MIDDHAFNLLSEALAKQVRLTSAEHPCAGCPAKEYCHGCYSRACEEATEEKCALNIRAWAREEVRKQYKQAIKLLIQLELL